MFGGELMNKRVWIIVFAVVFILGIIVVRWFVLTDVSLESNDGVQPTDILEEEREEISEPASEIVVENLEIPWEVAFLPSGEILLTERPGRLIKIGEDRTIIEVPGVRHIGEGGLLGLALHPNFKENQLIYLYLTSEKDGQLVNRVERYRLDDDVLSQRKVIVDGILGSQFHDGGRIEFGPDGFLYITTGDSGNPDLAQDTNSLNGKILRVKDDGTIPIDNPFGNAVYSFGHRNAQGIAWDNEGNLWATEHGRSGILSGLDELNLIKKGENYGWPVIQGDEERDGMITPVINSGALETWAPAGATFIGGSIFFAGLRGEALYEAKLEGTKVVELVKHLQGEFGRLRAVKLGPDGSLYVTTSNRDGRGTVQQGDDKLIRLDPRIFE